jgi:hypothetical protein
MIEELAGGRCDLTRDFGDGVRHGYVPRHPRLAGRRRRLHAAAVETIFAGFFGGDPIAQANAADEIKDYFERAIEARLEEPATSRRTSSPSPAG